MNALKHGDTKIKPPILQLNNEVGIFLHGHVGDGIAGGEGVVVSEDHCFGAVVAEGGLVVAADDGEGVEDVGGVCAGQAVEVEVEGVEAGAQVAALLRINAERFKMVTLE